MSDLLLWDKLLTRKVKSSISLTKDLDYEEDKCNKKEEPAVDNIIIKFRALLALMSNNKDYGRDREETLPAKRSSDDPSTPTGKTMTSLTKEDEPTLPAVTPSNILTKAAHKKKVIVVSPSPAKKPHDDESLSTRVKEAGQSFKDKVRSLGKKRPKLKQKRKQD